MAFVADMEMVAYDLKTAVFAELPWTILNIDGLTVTLHFDLGLFSLLRLILEANET